VVRLKIEYIKYRNNCACINIYHLSKCVLYYIKTEWISYGVTSLTWPNVSCVLNLVLLGLTYYVEIVLENARQVFSHDHF